MRSELFGVGVDRHQMQGQVAHHLGRGCHLRRAAEDLVGRRVHLLDLLELVPKPQRACLLPQIRQLAARDLVGVDPAGRAGQARLEGSVQLAGRLPVRLERQHRIGVEFGCPLGVRQAHHQRRHGRLRGGRRHRGTGHVDRVGTCLDGRQQGADLAAGCVVGVHLHGQIEVLTQRGDQLLGGVGAQQPGHVLDRERMRPGLDQLLGQPQVVVRGVQVFGRVEQVPAVAQRSLGDRTAIAKHRIDRRSQLLDVVECVEDTEDVDAHFGGLGDERLGDCGRVGGIADGVATAQQHLQALVGHGRPQRGEPLPGVFGQEAQRHVVGGPTPTLHRQQPGGEFRGGLGGVQQVDAA